MCVTSAKAYLDNTIVGGWDIQHSTYGYRHVLAVQTSLILLLLNSMAFMSCQNNLGVFSDNEMKGINEIGNFYGGPISFEKKWDENNATLIVGLKNTNIGADTQATFLQPAIIASNMAYILSLLSC